MPHITGKRVRRDIYLNLRKSSRTRRVESLATRPATSQEADMACDLSGSETADSVDLAGGSTKGQLLRKPLQLVLFSHAGELRV